jgi:hypothetical protein
MAPVSPKPEESGNPKPARSTSQDTAREADRKARLERIQALLADRADLDPLPQRWPKLALFAACLAVLAAGWWFYRDDAGDRSERTIPPALADEAPPRPKEAMKPAELDEPLQQAEWLLKTFEELLENERRRTAELEQKLAIRERDGQLLAQERARTKELEEQRSKELEEQLAARQTDQQSLAQARARINELEQQLAASRQLPPVQEPTTSPAAAKDSRNAAPVYRPPDEMTKPQPTVRRTGPRPLPKVTQAMPRLSLQASDLTYNPAGYWQVTATLISNTSRALDVRIQCSFLSAGRSVGEAESGPTPVAPGEQVSTDLIGPPTTAHVDSTTCHLVGQ